MKDPRGGGGPRGAPEGSGPREGAKQGERKGGAEAGLSDELATALLEELERALGEALLVFDAGGACRAAGGRARALLGLGEAPPSIPRDALTLDALDARLAARAAPPEGPGAPGEEHPSGGAPPSIALVRIGVPLLLGGREVGRLERLHGEAEEPVIVDRARFEREAGREHRRAQRTWSSYAVALVAAPTEALEGLEAGRPPGAGIGAALVGAARDYDLVARWDEGAFALLLPGADAAATTAALGRALRAAASAVDPAAEPPAAPALAAGAAVWIPPSGELPPDLFRRAAGALARARAGSREDAPEGSPAIEVEAGVGDFGGEMPEP